MTSMASTRADFIALPTGVKRNNAAARGWGDGYPHCQVGKWTKVTKAGVKVIVRKEIAELVATLFQITEELGYDIKAGQTWGAACRRIRGTNAPSNHSWALAVDINSLSNPMSTEFITDIPPKVVAAWWHCGWFWGGWYQLRPDPMHFEYVGTPEDVKTSLAKAKAILAELRNPTPPPAKPDGEPLWEPRRNAAPGSRNIEAGSVGNDVALVQRFLGIKPDNGRFGPYTTKRVKEYQKMRGLVVDGIVGPKTWAPILKALGLQ